MTEETSLRDWGLNEEHAAAFAERARPGESAGRVIEEHAGLFRVRTENATVLARPTGKLRQRIEEDAVARPVVGDWVVLGPIHSGETSLKEVLPRRAFLARKDPQTASVQPLVANVDTVFVVTSLAGDLNLRRLERYLATVYEGGARPVVVLTKSDMVASTATALEEVRAIAPEVDVHAVSAKTGEGMAELDRELQPGASIALIGSSGVGKSTLINRWLGSERLAVAEVSELGKGRHTTTHRHLVRTAAGALLIDTPGMRELALWEAAEGVDAAFPDIEELALSCRFSDCTHTREPGCAVRQAVEDGKLTEERVESFLKLRGELARLAAKGDAQARAARKSQEKSSTRALTSHLRKKRK